MNYKKINRELLEKLIEVREQSAAFNSEDSYNNSLLGIRDNKDEAYERIMRNFEKLSYEWACKVIDALCNKYSIPHRLWATTYNGLEYNLTPRGDIVLEPGSNTETEIVKVPLICEDNVERYVKVETINRRDTITIKGEEYDLKIWVSPKPSLLSRTVERKRIMVFLIDDSQKSIKFIEKQNKRSKEEYNGLIENYTFYVFIVKVFGKEELAELQSAVKELKTKMKQKIGTRLTDVCDNESKRKFLKKFRKELELKDYRQYLRKYPISIESNNGRRYDIFEEDYDDIKKNFIDSGRYLVLLGDNDFAQSLFTAEWLYEKYSSQAKLDNTFIIAGYIKSVEQLLWSVIYLIGRGRQIGHISHRETIGDEAADIRATLEEICYFISSYSNEDLCDSRFGRYHRRNMMQYLKNAIVDYKDNCRNGYFHKHNLDKQTVEEIREKTFMLYYLILGIFSIDDSELRILGRIDEA